MTSVKISVSNLFVIMEMNFFKKFDKVVADSWRSCNYADYKKWVTKAESQNKIPATLPEIQQIKKYEKKHNLNLKLEETVKKSQSQSNNKDMRKIRDESIIKVSKKLKNVNPDDNKRIEKLMIKTTNTNYGTLQENSGIKAFEKEKKLKVSSSQTRFNQFIGDEYGYEWILVGKVDGITSDGCVLEIKNRVKCLFHDLRSYEKPQLMVYLYLSGKSKGYMMEQCKDGNSVEYDIIELKYIENYFDELVLPKINKFKKFFANFMVNDTWKEWVIDGKESELYKQYQSIKY